MDRQMERYIDGQIDQEDKYAAVLELGQIGE